MEEIYANVESMKAVDVGPPKKERTPTQLKTSLVIVFLGLSSFLLLAGLVSLAVAYSRLLRMSRDIRTNLTLSTDLIVERDSLITNLTDRLSTLTEERDSLRDDLKKRSNELESLHAESRGQRATGFNGSCYILPTQSLSWGKARDFCLQGGADLVTINSAEEQGFVSEWITEDTWIGLNDREEEGVWRWVKDDSLQPQGFWSKNQPDNWNFSQEWGREDCVHVKTNTRKWNDAWCNNSLNFICEKNT